MTEALKGYSWVRVMPSVYVVKIDGPDGRDVLHERFKEIVQSVPEPVHYLISPPMEGGRYNGWLPKRLWPKLNERID